MRAIPDSMDAAIVSSIDGRLDRIQVDDHVRVLWAIESGSRAWGFPSPDSDYDARFFYLRPAADYLSPWPRRDVIETPLDKIYDVNGWDVAKALRLLVKGNGTVTEWLTSPIVYRADEQFGHDLLELAEQVLDRALLGRHYLHLGLQWTEFETAPLKRAFYALRPAAILRWLETNPDRMVPPMNLRAILAECDPPAALVAATEELIELKATVAEAGHGEVPSAITSFIRENFAKGEAEFDGVERGDPAEAIARCESFFSALVARMASSR